MLKNIDLLVRGIWKTIGVPEKYIPTATWVSEAFFFGVLFFSFFA